ETAENLVHKTSKSTQATHRSPTILSTLGPGRRFSALIILNLRMRDVARRHVARRPGPVSGFAPGFAFDLSPGRAMSVSSASPPIPVSPAPAAPRVEILYCRQCRWLLRAAWMGQELLTTFSEEIGELALKPGTGGIFEVRVDGELI